MFKSVFEKLYQIWTFKDLRKRIFFVIALLVVFRIAAHIPIPEVNLKALRDFFQSNELMGMLNVLSGSAMSNFSIVALGVGPYITASIIMQLLTWVIPKLEDLMKEGEVGYQKINQYTRLLTVPLAALQGYGLIILLSQSGQNILGSLNIFKIANIILVLVVGTVFLMWLGELISEKKVGNGISLIIFAGIIERLPLSVQRTIITLNQTQILNLIIFIIIGIVTVAGVVILTEGQRNIPVSYAKRIRGMRMYGGMDTYLPIKVNQAGMIPIIFAIALILLPSFIGQIMIRFSNQFINSIGQGLINLFQNQFIYGLFYFLLVFIFTYFYTSIIFRPDQISENIQKQGGFIPGLRPGAQTASYLSKVSNRIMLAGALGLGIIAVLPLITQSILGIRTFTIGGASLIIVVAVIIETWKQIEAQLEMREYETI